MPVDSQPQAFPDIAPIRYEGPTTKNMLAFRHYDADALVEGRSMRDHLRFAVSYWHTFRGTGSDPFGAPTMLRPWEQAGDPLAAAIAICKKNKVRLLIASLDKLNRDMNDADIIYSCTNSHITRAI